MTIGYKLDILKALKDHGFSTYRLRKEKIFGESTISQFRSGEIVYGKTLEKLCSILECQPGDIIEFKEE